MRPIQEPGFAPLPDHDQDAMLRQHIPYRIELLKAGVRPLGAINQQDNQAAEAGIVSGRILLSFLGLGYDSTKGTLKLDRDHRPPKGPTDDVKIRDVGGRFVELGELGIDEAEALAKFIHGAHKACAHFTIGSKHELTVPIFQKAVPVILRLLDACLPLPPPA